MRKWKLVDVLKLINNFLRIFSDLNTKSRRLQKALFHLLVMQNSANKCHLLCVLVENMHFFSYSHSFLSPRRSVFWHCTTKTDSSTINTSSLLLQWKTRATNGWIRSVLLVYMFPIPNRSIWSPKRSFIFFKALVCNCETLDSETSNTLLISLSVSSSK